MSFITHNGLAISLLLIVGVAGFSCHERLDTAKDVHHFRLNSAAKFYVVDDETIIGKRIPVNQDRLPVKKAGFPSVRSRLDNRRVAGKLREMKGVPPDTFWPGKNGVGRPMTTMIRRIREIEMPMLTIPAGSAVYGEPNTYSIAGYGRAQGLKSDIVTCLLQDDRGNLWIGTKGGITCYDGHNFTGFPIRANLSDSDVKSMLKDKNGRLWFGTNGEGVWRYDGRSLVNFGKSNGLSGDVVASLAEDSSGNIWIGTLGGGIDRYDGRAFTNYTKNEGLAGDSVDVMICDPSGNLWIGTSEGISEFNGSSFVNYHTQQGLTDNNVCSLMWDHRGRLWAGTLGGGVGVFDGRCFYALTRSEGLISDTVFSLIQGNDEDVWIGTRNGLERYDGNTFTVFTEEQGLLNTNIYCLLHDNTGNIWMGTGGGGLLKYNPYSFIHFTRSDGLKKNFIFSIYEDRSKHLWAGTWRGGVTEFDGTSLKTFSTKQGLPDNDVRSITQDNKQDIWFATGRGIVRYDKLSFQYLTKADGLASDDANCIAQDSRDNLWIGTERGASRYDGHSITNFFLGDDPLRVFFIKEDRKGEIWFATSSGIFMYDGVRMSQLGDSVQVIKQNIYHIDEDADGDLWFATPDGILKYDGHRIIRISTGEGLISNDVTGVLADHLGNIWIGTGAGFSKLSREKSDILSSRIKHNEVFADDALFENFGYSDDFQTTGVNRGAMTETKDHRIVAGTTNGITFFEPEKAEKDALPPHMHITDVKIANQDIEWGLLNGKGDSAVQLAGDVQLHDFEFDSVTGWDQVPAGLRLPADNNYINIYFSGATLDRSQTVVYNYRLLGANNHASTYTTQPYATYGNLAPRHYVFTVRAKGADGNWSDGAVFAFTINPPWWQTWWFLITLFLIFGYGIFYSTRLFFKLRMQKQKSILEKDLALQYERQRISTDLHDDIGSTLSSINIYSNLARKDKNREEYLESIKTNVNEVVEKLDDLVWKINPKYDTIESVINRLVFYATPLTHAKQISFDLKIEDDIKPLKLDTEKKQHIFLIIKELLNNSIKHAGCKHLVLSFSLRYHKLVIIVDDDGCGMTLSNRSTHRNGLKNIEDRAEKINAEFNITTRQNEGVRSCLSVSLK